MKIRLDIIYRTPKKTEARFVSDELNVAHALLIAEDLEKSGRLKQLIFLDRADMTWTLKELRQYKAQMQTEVQNVTLYFDGGYDHELKQAGLGCVIYYEQNKQSYRLRINALVEELASSNEAEYAALHLGLKELERLDVQRTSVTLIGDSQVVINQLTDAWPCYEEQLVRWIERIERLIKQLQITPTYQLIPRKENQAADRLATQALNGIDIMAQKKITDSAKP